MTVKEYFYNRLLKFKIKWNKRLCSCIGHVMKEQGGVACRKCQDPNDIYAGFGIDHATAVLECSRQGCGYIDYEDYPDCDGSV